MAVLSDVVRRDRVSRRSSGEMAAAEANTCGMRSIMVGSRRGSNTSSVGAVGMGKRCMVW